MRFLFVIAAAFCSVVSAQTGTSCCDPSTPSCQTAIRYCMNNTSLGGAAGGLTNCQARR